MATKTYVIRNALAGTFQEISEGSAGAAVTTASKWTVGTTAPTVYSYLNAGSTQANGTFTGTAKPDTSVPGTSSGDSFRTLNTLQGSFAAGNWTITTGFISNDSAGTGDGRIRMRVFRGPNANGSGATEITSSVLIGSTVTNLQSGTAQGSTITWSAPEIVLNNEYLFFRAAWEITGAGRAAGVDHSLRAEAGNTISTTDFTPAAFVTPTTGQTKLAGQTPSVAAGGVILDLFNRLGATGMWVDPVNGMRAYTDTAGTTEAAIGEAVARLDAQDGGVAAQFTNATAGQRPIRRTAGLEFDGVDDSLSYPDDPALRFGTSSFTVAIAVMPDVVTGQHGLFSKRGSGAAGTRPGWGLRQSNSALFLEYDYTGNAGDTLFFMSGSAFSTATWTTLLVEMDVVAGQATARVNGVAQTPVAITTGDISGTQPLVYGAEPTNAFFTDGKLGRALVIDKLLSESDKQIVEEWITPTFPAPSPEVGITELKGQTASVTIHALAQAETGQSRAVGQNPSLELGLTPTIVGTVRVVGNAPSLGIGITISVGQVRMVGNVASLSTGVGGLWHQVPPAASPAWGQTPDAASPSWGHVPHAH